MIDQPKPVLTHDKHHQPKTTGSVGLMIAGLGEPMGPPYSLVLRLIDSKFNGMDPRGKLRHPIITDALHN